MQKELAIPAGIFSLDLELEFRITVAARRIDRTHGSDLELCDGICREHQFQIADMLAVNTQRRSSFPLTVTITVTNMHERKKNKKKEINNTQHLHLKRSGLCRMLLSFSDLLSRL